MSTSRDRDEIHSNYNVHLKKDEDIKSINDKIDTINETLEQIKKSTTKFDEITEQIQNAIKKDSTYPPISLKSYLSMIWGTALELESDPIQNKTGTALRENVQKILESFHAKKDKDNPSTPIEKIHSNFIHDLSLISVKAIHNIAHLRTVHESFFREEERKLENLKTTYEERAKFTSFSKEGLLSKAVTFIGGGSLISVIPFLDKIVNSTTSDEKIAQLEKLLELTKKYDVDSPITETKTVTNAITNTGITNVTSVDTITTESTVPILEDQTNPMYDKVLEATSEQIDVVISAPPEFNIALFLVIGILSVFGVSLAYKIFAHFKFEDYRTSKNQCIESYLMTEFKPKIKNVLEESYRDFRDLAIKYYQKEDQTNFWNDFLVKERFPKVNNKSSDETDPNQENINRYIDEHIIPNFLFKYTKEGKEAICPIDS